MTPPVPPVPPAGSGGPYAASPPPIGAPQPPLTPPGPPLNPTGGTYGGRGDNKANLLGYLSVVFGILGLTCCCLICLPWIRNTSFIGSIPAIVLGILHIMKVKKGRATMPWLGWTGLALGLIALIGSLCFAGSNYDDRIVDEYNRQFGDV